MRPILRRTFACLMIFGGGAVALTPALGWEAAVALSAFIVLAIAYWLRRQHRRLGRELREAITREEARQ